MLGAPKKKNLHQLPKNRQGASEPQQYNEHDQTPSFRSEVSSLHRVAVTCRARTVPRVCRAFILDLWLTCSQPRERREHFDVCVHDACMRGGLFTATNTCVQVCASLSLLSTLPHLRRPREFCLLSAIAPSQSERVRLVASEKERMKAARRGMVQDERDSPD